MLRLGVRGSNDTGRMESEKEPGSNRHLRSAVPPGLRQRRGGVCFLHVKGHAGNMGNEFADWLVQRGKELGLYSRLADNEPESTEQQLARRAVRDEMCARHVTATLADGTLHFGTVTTEGGATMPLAVKRKLSPHAQPFLSGPVSTITVQFDGNGSMAAILETEGRCPECERPNEQPLSIEMAEGAFCDTCLQQARAAAAAADTHTHTYTTDTGRGLDFDGKQEPYGENHQHYVEAETRQYKVDDHNASPKLALASSNDDKPDSQSCNRLNNVTQSSTRHVNPSGIIKTPSD